MKKVLSILTVLMFCHLGVQSQLNYLTTVPPYNGGNGSSMVAFNVKAHKAIRIREMYCTFSASTSQTTIIWYKTDSINGTPSVSTASGWIQAHNFTHSPNPFGNGTVTLISDTSLNILVPAGATYAFAISGSSVRYTGSGTTSVSPWIIGDSNLYINMAGNVGYGGTLTSPINYRQYNGKIGYEIVNQETDAGLEGFQIPGDTICAASLPVTVNLKNHGPNGLQDVKIAWNVNGIPQPDHLWTGNLPVNGSTAVNIGNFLFAPGVSYTISAHTVLPNNIADTINNSNDTVSKSNIYVKPTPTINLNDTLIIICPGDSVIISGTLTGSPPWQMLINDGTTNTPLNNIQTPQFNLVLYPTITTTYTITSLGDATGCLNTSNPEIQVIAMPPPPSVINPVGGTACCAGDSVILMGSVGLNFSYQWHLNTTPIPGATNYLYGAKQSGSYTLKVISPNGCTAMSAPVNVFVHPAPPVNLGNDTALQPHQSILLDAGAGFNSYQWSNNASSQTITVDTNGYGLGLRTIWVRVTDNNACPGSDTIQINFTQNPGIKEVINSPSLGISPNPSSGKIVFQLTDFLTEEVVIEILNQDGMLINRYTEMVSNRKQTVSINLHHLPNGLYIVKVNGANDVVTRKFIISK
jgi:hypothetical protein